ncbi:MAG: glycosyltransferase [Bacteroidota bacterium]
MKILIVSPRFPYAMGKADSMTVFHMIRYFWQQKHEVILATFHNREKFPEEERQLVRKMCKEVRVVHLSKMKVGIKLVKNALSKQPFQVAYYRDQAMKKHIDELVQKHQPDILYAHLIRAAHYIEGYQQHPRILAMQIAQTLNYSRLIKHERKWYRKLFYTQEYRRVAQMEPKVIHNFDRVLLISPHDKKAIVPNGQAKKVFYSPHGIDVDYFAEDLQLSRQQNTVMMNADFGVPTNIDAALYFYNEILPIIKKTIPEIKFWVVGRNPAPSILRLNNDPAVTVTGKVPDIRPYLQQATAGIAPLRVGAGLQNKVLVSLASQLPVVATSIANEGIAAPVDEVLLVADEKNHFAESLIFLLQNEKERQRIGKNALAFMKASWTWEFHFEKLEKMFQRLTVDKLVDVQNYYPF